MGSAEDHPEAGPSQISDRLRTVLQASRSVVSDLSLEVVLRRIVGAARHVSGARYAALGVLGPRGPQGRIEQLIHVGFDEETVAAIGDIPKGHGLLGALIRSGQPIRVADLTADPRFRGFPPHHPQMKTFLGVPIIAHDEVFGNLYLGERRGGEFTADDEELVLSLAASAGVAISNARLYARAHARQEWLAASGEVSRRLLDPRADDREMLRCIADSVHRLAAADLVAVVLPTQNHRQLRVAVATGEGADQVVGRQFAAEDSLAAVGMSERRGVLAASSPDLFGAATAASGPVLAVPLSGQGAPRGAVVATRRLGGRSFAETDLQLAATFANQAALALELAEARRDHERLALLEERDRIGQDLHDHVIQRLYAAGLSLRTAADVGDFEQLQDRAAATVTELDATIREIRRTILRLEALSERRTLHDAVLAVLGDLGPLLDPRPAVAFSGEVDQVVEDAVVVDAEAVVREALMNVIKHASATTVAVSVRVTADGLAIEVRDNGLGVGEQARWSGLANLDQRARRHGGRLSLASEPDRGTTLTWTIPPPS